MGTLSKEDGVLIWGDSELNVEGVVPNLLHIVPVLNDTVLNGIKDLENTSLLLGLITEILVLPLNTDGVGNILGSADDGREDSSGVFFS